MREDRIGPYHRLFAAGLYKRPSAFIRLPKIFMLVHSAHWIQSTFHNLAFRILFKVLHQGSPRQTQQEGFVYTG